MEVFRLPEELVGLDWGSVVDSSLCHPFPTPTTSMSLHSPFRRVVTGVPYLVHWSPSPTLPLSLWNPYHTRGPRFLTTLPDFSTTQSTVSFSPHSLYPYSSPDQFLPLVQTLHFRSAYPFPKPISYPYLTPRKPTPPTLPLPLSIAPSSAKPSPPPSQTSPFPHNLPPPPSINSTTPTPSQP